MNRVTVHGRSKVFESCMTYGLGSEKTPLWEKPVNWYTTPVTENSPKASGHHSTETPFTPVESHPTAGEKWSTLSDHILTELDRWPWWQPMQCSFSHLIHHYPPVTVWGIGTINDVLILPFSNRVYIGTIQLGK